MDPFFANLISSAGGGAIVGGLVLWLVNRTLSEDRDEREKLAARVEVLETQKLDGLKKDLSSIDEKLTTHLEEDNPKEVLRRFENIDQALSRLHSVLERKEERQSAQYASVSRQLGELSEGIKSNDRFLDNLNKDFQRHQQNQGIHGHVNQ